jgi:hypothetical protein
VLDDVRMHWQRVGYLGDYDSWLAQVTPAGAETGGSAS